jgi:hypothetical protein
MRAELNTTPGPSTPRGALTPGAASPGFVMSKSGSPLPQRPGDREEEPNHQEEWARQEQQVCPMCRLSSCAGTIQFPLL